MGEIEKRYIELRGAIVKQAIEDYKKASIACAMPMKADDEKARKKRAKALKTRRECERFFLSDWCQALSSNYGEYILERTKREIAEELAKKIEVI